MATISEALLLAFDHHRAGRSAEAETLYVRILHADPEQPDAAHLLGVLCLQTGRPGLGGALIRRAVACRPDAAAYHSNLGNVRRQTGDDAAAGAAYARALRLDPGLADAHANRAAVLRALGRAGEAAAAARRALALAPDHAEGLTNLADALLADGGPALAETAARRAAAVRPGLAAAVMVLAGAHAAVGRWEAAEVAYRAALDRDPALAAAQENLGALLAKLGRRAEALAALDAAERLRPDRPPLAARGNALLALGEPAAAASCFARALAERPFDAGLHWNRAFACLLAGDYAEGWAEFEWRRADDRARPPWRRFDRPTWRGEDVAGRRLLLYAEQGLGDTLQFVRYVPLVAARGARVVLEVQPPLLMLLSGMEGAERVIARGDPLPDFDLECPLMSLPGAFATRPATVPAAVPYLHPDPARAAVWRRRLSGDGPAVGLVWAGNPQFPGDRLRSPRLEGLRPVLEVPGVRFFGLQAGEGRADLEGAALPPTFTDLGGALHDFAETAAVMAGLDLVITSCTAPAHLAGALGVPVWVVLPLAPDWRWMLGRDDSPWYPTARLFRQDRVGDWQGVARRVAEALRALAG
ncbi:tetratricopeptide repeat protein [Azospirillum halopraeferens]|uniref:tetratricopeptide repeat protein n=1 Tax=Azospirillum halopraeferens TaxID=34010 RepID=UPI00048F347F|nr:tetratricopeptide repeat protein [Azospirillum halopraeferens]